MCILYSENVLNYFHNRFVIIMWIVWTFLHQFQSRPKPALKFGFIVLVTVNYYRSFALFLWFDLSCNEVTVIELKDQFHSTFIKRHCMQSEVWRNWRRFLSGSGNDVSQDKLHRTCFVYAPLGQIFEENHHYVACGNAKSVKLTTTASTASKTKRFGTKNSCNKATV
jgi:hypothetical protein